MNLLDILRKKPVVSDQEVDIKGSSATFNAMDYDTMKQAFGFFTGSTIPGTMSLPQPWRLDYYALRERSWQAYTENELAAAFVDRLRQFVVNTGLRLQYEPSPLLTEHLGIEISEDDAAWIERDFALYAGCPAASLDGKKDLHTLADEAYLNMLNAGDLLVVLHIVNGEIKVQHIDGRQIVSPWDRETQLKAIRRGNTISEGVERDKKGREVAYYVRQDNYFTAETLGWETNRPRTERIPAKGKSGRIIAFRPSRDNQRIGSSRGKPILTPVLQNLEVTRRYKLAELLAAEVNAMIVWAIEHEEISHGLNPLENLPHGTGRRPTDQAPELGGWSSENGDNIAGRITEATAGMAVNLGRGQKLKATDTKRPNISGAEFLDKMNVDTAAAVSIPFEIARMLFSNNYSASRAALEMFKILIAFERKQLTDEYYAPIARERQRLRSLQGRIPAHKSYKKAIISRDETLMAGFEKYRFTGVVVPHVDPKKEVDAAVERINNKLSTRDKETEALGTGDFEANVARLKKEQDILDKAGLLDTVDEEQESGLKTEEAPNGSTKDED